MWLPIPSSFSSSSLACDPVQPTRLCLRMSNCSHTASSHFMSFSVSVARNPILWARMISHSDACDPFLLSLQLRRQGLPCIPGVINLSPHCKTIQVGVFVVSSLRAHLDHLESSVSDNLAVITLHHWSASENDCRWILLHLNVYHADWSPHSRVLLSPASLESRVP